MSRADVAAPHRVVLPDGRIWAAASEPDLRFAWEEIFERHAYLDAAARVRPGGAVVDVGAHVGLSALYFLERSPAEIVIACEPAAATFACLQENFRGSRRVHPLKLALGEAPGHRWLTYYPDAPTQSGLYADEDRDTATTLAYLVSTGYTEREARFLVADLHESTSEDVEVDTLSSVIDRFGLERIDLVKVDVERAEHEVLRGIDDRHWPRIGALVVEIHDLAGRLDLCSRQLTELGYEVTCRQEPWLQGSELYTALAVRPRGS